MKIIYEKKEEKQAHLTIHSLDELKDLMKRSYDCLFFAGTHNLCMYSLYLDKKTNTLTRRAHMGESKEITEEDIGDFCYFKLDDREFSDILNKL